MLTRMHIWFHSNNNGRLWQSLKHLLISTPNNICFNLLQRFLYRGQMTASHTQSLHCLLSMFTLQILDIPIQVLFNTVGTVSKTRDMTSQTHDTMCYRFATRHSLLDICRNQNNIKSFNIQISLFGFRGSHFNKQQCEILSLQKFP